MSVQHPLRKTLQNRAFWLFLVIVFVALITRLIDLGARVMSHDEINHVYFAWLWFDGGSYQHNPVSHGPLQFHLLYLSYTLLGDSDFSARLPAALAGIASIGLLWPFRRWLKERGVLMAAALMLFSPFMLYYARYARNEAYVVFETLLTLLAIFRYLESKQPRWLYILVAVLALHAATKETYYIQTAQWMIFLAAWLVVRLLRAQWLSTRMRSWFAGSVALSVFGLGLALLEFLRERSAAGDAAVLLTSSLVFIGAALGILGLIIAAVVLVRSFGARLREDFPQLDVLLVMTTLTLPLLGALPAQALGWDPMAYSDTTEVTRTSVIVIVLLILSCGAGVVWNRKRWLTAAGIFALIYIPLYTTFFTNPFGLFSGLVGSLGYWLVQQGVERGSQPWYYYLFLQIPIYEYLPALGAIAGSVLALRRAFGNRTTPAPDDSSDDSPRKTSMLAVYLIYSWLSTLLVYSYAGERMPWITVHLVLPMILLSGWWFSRAFESATLRLLFTPRTLSAVGVGLLIATALYAMLRSISGLQAGVSTVFQDMEQITGWLLPIAVSAVAAVFLRKLIRPFEPHQLLKISALVMLAVLLIHTIRTSFRAAFVNYDSAKEYMVYAHAAPGPKLALEMIEDLSHRTTGGLDLPVAYDNDAAYPFWWYLRHYPRAFGFGEEPNRTLRDYPVVFASDTNSQRYEAYLGDAYQAITFERLWWPREDYTGWTWQTVRETLSNPEMLGAVWDIWHERDYTRYGQITGTDVSTRGWQPAGRMKMYIRQDYAAGVMGLIEPGEAGEDWTWGDVYDEQMVVLQPELVLGGPGSSAGFFSAPRGLAVDARDWLYVADSNNHRVQVFSSTGELQRTWGMYADASTGEAAPSGFNQPWDLAVASDGSVIVVDTWNHRILRFSADGAFIQRLDTGLNALVPSGLYGPRAAAIDASDRVFIVDTGNKRVLVVSLQGDLLGSFGSGGLGIGNLDEPVGLAVDADGRIWIADTWNQRLQSFAEGPGNQFEPLAAWPIEAWFGQSLENKPYVAVSPGGDVCVTDPEGGRVLCFTAAGDFKVGFSGAGLVLPSGLVFTEQCHLWVADSGTDRILRFDPGLCP